MKGVLPLVLVALVVVFAGCLTDKGELIEEVPQSYCDSLQPAYIDTVKILIDSHCATSVGCHGLQSSNGDFTTYANMQAAGVLSESKIGFRVSSLDINQVMPQFNPLPDSLRQVFECWVNSGFPQQ
tara:strand:- start:105 stop:482 length:378 start_codon:yes stop_codon:yes gene_type:complete